MKGLYTKTTKRISKALLIALGLFLAVTLHLGASGITFQTVRALSTFNSDPKDFSTLRSSNYTQFPDSTTNWADTTNANAGETVSLAVYYHNASQETAKNVRVTMSMPGTTGTDIIASGTLGADNFNTSSGNTTIHLSSSQSLQYIPGSASWYPNQSTTSAPFPAGQTGDEVITSGGVTIGDVDPGWSTQGSVVARFKVSQNLPPPPPTGGSTLDIVANGSQGPVTLANGQSFTLDWISSSVSNCVLSESDVPFSSGVTQNGSMGPVDPIHPFYPPAGANYTFVISCQGLSGPISDSVVVSRSAPQKPLDPPNLFATTGVACGGTIDLTWNAVSGATSYKIFRDGSLLATSTGVSFTDTGLVLGSSHQYRIHSINATQESADSDIVATFASGQCLNSTLDIVANGSQGPVTLANGQSFTLDWISSSVSNCVLSESDVPFSSGVTQNGSMGPVDPIHPFYPPAGANYTFVISCQGLSGPISDSVVVIHPLPVVQIPQAPQISNVATDCSGAVTLSWNMVNGATTYKVFRNSVQIASTSSASFVDQNTVPNTQYSYTVKAGNEAGDSVFSNSVTTTTPTSCVTKPIAPTIFAVAGSSCGSTAFVSWNAVQNATSYNVFRNGVQVATSSNVSFTDSGLTQNLSYSYTVQAVNSAGTSPLSNVASTVASGLCLTVPAAPSLGAATGTQCGGTIALSWNSVTNVTSYKVFRDGNQIATTTNTSYVDSGITPGSSHNYTVKATNTVGDSVSSNQVSAVASAQCPLPIPTVSLTANPTTINQGDSSLLTWNSQNTSSCSALWTNATSTSGNQSVSPATTTIYSILCSNGVASTTATTTITVNTTPLSTPTVSLVANPTSISQGQNSTLSWTSTNATNCSALWTTATTTSGSKVVGPATTTVYTIACSNATKTATSTATVTVNPIIVPPCVAPTITSSLTANGKAGQSFSYTLVASSTATTTLSYSIATSSLPDGLVFSGNTITGTPTHSGTFTVNISSANSCGTDNENLVITIDSNGGGGGDNSVQVNLNANPSTINIGAISTLAWTSSNATNCSAIWTTSTSTSGNQVVSPATTAVYSINCSNSSKSNTATTTINVLPITPACVLPNLTSPFTANGTVGQAFTYTLAAAGSTTPTFIIGTSTLPAGLAFSGNTISGTPTVTGTFVIPVSVSNTCGLVTNNSITIIISPSGGGGNPISVTLTANPNTIAPGATSTLTWVSTDTTACAADWTSATSTSGNFDVSPQTTTAYIIHCSNSSQTATSSATVTVSTPPPPSGGGGGGGGGCGPRGCVPGSTGGGGGYVPVPTVLGASLSCDYLHDYLHIGWQNNSVEMLKLQLFLKDLEGFNNLQITGVFDQPTFDAVSQFQVQFQPDILTPWGYAQGESTGYVYILTKKKINEIFCQTAYPLNGQQKQEIVDFRALLEGLRSHGISVSGLTTVNTAGGSNTSLTSAQAPTTTTVGNVLGLSSENPEQNTNGFLSSQNLSNIAAVAFAGPQGWTESIQSAVIFFLILLFIYAAAHAIVSNQNNKRQPGQVLSTTAVRVRTALFFIGGIILALILCLIFHYYFIILPLLLLIIIASATMLWFSLESKTEHVLTTTIATSTTSTTTTATPVVAKTEPIEPTPPVITQAHLPEKDTVVEILNDK